MMTTETEQALTMLRMAPRIACVCHKNPDGDALGSLLALVGLLQREVPGAEVTAHCVDPVPETLRFLPNHGIVRRTLEVQPGDLVVFLDAADRQLTGLQLTHPQLFDGTIETLVIDHHHKNPRFGTANIILNASSTCEIVAGMAKDFGWSLTPDIATCLLTGTLTDTGGMLHSNTTAAVYRLVADLQRAGARHQQIVNAVFRTAKLSTLRLWGRMLEKISVTDDGGAISAVTEGDFRATGADPTELSGAIDYVNAVPGMRFSMVLSERGGQVKGSLRTLRDDVDVSAMAAKYPGGGGHKKAAGFSVGGKLKQEVNWKVVEEK